jgi:calcineurin-like phosphoesterase family protein
MPHEKWFISDTHFFHSNIIKYCSRPFASANEMNTKMVENWNKVVGKNDYVYHLGDFWMGGNNKERNDLLYALNGQITLIVGNHDDIRDMSAKTRFRKIELWKGFKGDNFTCVHIPLRLDSLRDGAFCVHGHIHDNLEKDPHYINVCVEHHNYTPVHLDAIREIIKQRK